MPYAKSWAIKIGSVIICKIIREDDSSSAKIVMWKTNKEFVGTNETILELAKTMVPEPCRQFVTIEEEE